MSGGEAPVAIRVVTALNSWQDAANPVKTPAEARGVTRPGRSAMIDPGGRSEHDGLAIALRSDRPDASQEDLFTSNVCCGARQRATPRRKR
jgi:hypothetical protein